MMTRESPEVRAFDGSRDMTDRWLSVEETAEYLGVSKDTVLRGSTNETCQRIESADSGNSNPKRSTSGCTRMARRKTKGEKRNEGLGFCWFRSSHAAVETRTGELT
jgi:hypothetical protein